MKIYIFNFIKNISFSIYIDFLILNQEIRSEKYRLIFNINNNLYNKKILYNNIS